MKSAAAHRRLDHLRVRGVQPPVQDVLADRPPEQRCLLGHQPDLTAQAVHGHVADIDAVDLDRARRHVPQGEDQPDQGGLAGARRPDQREGLPPRYSAPRRAGRVGRAGTRTSRRRADPAGDGSQRPGVGCIEHRGPRVDDLEHPLDGAGPPGTARTGSPASPGSGSPSIATPYSRNPVRVPIPSVPSMTW